MRQKMNFTFGKFKTSIHICREIPDLNLICAGLDINNLLIIADENTALIADKICGGLNPPRCIIKSGEENKNWKSVELILAAAVKANLGRDCLFLAVGGGIVCDLGGFAASIYMRGCRLTLVPTSLLAMVDSSVGGKTGFDLFGVKNLAGAFYPAEDIFIPLMALCTLPDKEWKNGYAELIKTAVLAGSFAENSRDDFLEFGPGAAGSSWDQEASMQGTEAGSGAQVYFDKLACCIERAVVFKAGIVSEDLLDTGKRRLLNLGHTFAHALESAAGFGKISHGEAVAWGIARSCELGRALGATPEGRAKKIMELIEGFGYSASYSYETDAVIKAMQSDKKKKSGKLTFIVPDDRSARPVMLETEDDLALLKNILTEKSKK